MHGLLLVSTWYAGQEEEEIDYVHTASKRL